MNLESAIVGVDVGGTKTAIGVVDFRDAKVLRREELPTPARAATGAGFLEEVARRANALAEAVGASAIGVSICELVASDGEITSAHRVMWQGLRLDMAFARPVVVEADVRAGAVAEARFGAGRGFRDLLYVNLGTGVSSAWVRDGVAHKGARGNALLIGSSPVEVNCPFCGEPHGYVPEEIAGAAGLVAEYRAAGGAASTAGDVFAAAGRGDAQARAVLERAVLALGLNIGLAVNVLDPEALVLGGGLALAGGAYGDALEAAIRSHVWADTTRGLPILRARLGADSALIGAACAAEGDPLPLAGRG